MQRRVDLAIVIAVALLANFAFMIASNGDYYYPDSFTYISPAQSLLHGHGFLNAKGEIDTLRTPGYPLLLVLFGVKTLPVILLQHLLNAALAAAIYLLVFYRIGSRFAALTASLLFALDTPTIHYANKILSEAAFTVVLFVVFFLMLGRPRPMVIGILTGFLVLLRPIAIVYFVLLVLLYAIWHISLRQMAVLVLAALLLPLAWAGRNAARTGVFTISAIAGYNMLNHRAAGALAMEDGGDFRSDLADEQQGLTADADDAIQQRLGVADAQDLPDSVRAREYSRFALQVIARHPFGFAGLLVRSFLWNLFDSDWDSMQMVSRVYAPIVELTVGVIPAIELALAVIGVIALWRIDRRMALLAALTILYFVTMSAGSEAEARFRVPVMPQMVIAAAAGIEAARRGLFTSVTAARRGISAEAASR